MGRKVTNDNCGDVGVLKDGAGSGHFEVLVVEDDSDCLEEYCEFLKVLGYSCLKATDGAEALKLLCQNPSIGVVVTDIGMPSMDGLALLGELQARFTPFRPLVPVVITGMANFETAVEAMRTDAIDFLSKPVSLAKLAATMRRASARWAMLRSQFRLLALIEKGGFPSETKSTVGNPTKSGMQVPDRQLLKKFLRSIVRARQRRHEFMDSSSFADPAWDIMLDLTSAALEGRSVPVLGATAAANVPVTTALRYVNQLVAGGAVKRWDDPTDKRRSLLALEDQSLERMLKYLTHAWSSMAGDVFSNEH